MDDDDDDDDATTCPELAVANSWAPPCEIGYYPAARGPDGKQVMSAQGRPEDRDAGRPLATRISAEAAAEMHRARRVKAAKQPPRPLTREGAPRLFDCPADACPPPLTADAATILDPLRRPFCRVPALEDSSGPGVPVVGLQPGHRVAAYMEPEELKALSEKASRVAYAIIERVAANLPGGCHMFRVGDGSHKPHPRSQSVGLATAWAVFRGPWHHPVYALRARARAPEPDTWLAEGCVAYGGCLGPGATINSGEVAAAVACLREAIHVRRNHAAARRHRYFNVIYAIDSDSCADEMDRMWTSGNLGGGELPT